MMTIIGIQVVLVIFVFLLDGLLPKESDVKKSLMPLLGATFLITMVAFLLMS